MTTARPVAAELEPADHRKRIGVVLFDEDVTTEDSLTALSRGAEVSIHYARMPVPLGASPAALDKAARDLAAAAATLAPSTSLSALVYACTTNTLELGEERVREAFAASRPGVPAATPITGAIKALEALNVRKVAVLTPYREAHNALIASALRTSGLEVVDFVALDAGQELDYARVSADSIGAAAWGAMAGGQAEALLISCAALPATGLIEALEAALGRPVVTSAQAMWREALVLAGAPLKATRGGRLFAL